MAELLRSAVVIVALVMGAFSSAPAVAQDVPPGMGPEALQSFQRGTTHAQARDWEAAAREFQRSYDLEPRKESLFAWAQAERLRGNCARAVDLYRRVLPLDLTPKQKQAAERNLERCDRSNEEARREAALGTASTAAANPPLSAPIPGPPGTGAPPVNPAGLRGSSGRATDIPPPIASKRSLLLGAVLHAGTAVGLAGAVTFFMLSRASVQQASDDFLFREYTADLAEAHRRQRFATGFAAAGVLFGGATVLYWLAPRSGRETAPTTSVAFVGPDGPGLTLRGPF